MEELAPDDPRAQLFGAVGFDRALVGARLVAVGGGRALVRLEVTPPVENPLGTLHGGAIATLVDDVGTVAIMSADAEGRPGVTTDLSVSYMAAAPSGSTVLVEAQALKTGRTLAFVEVELRTAEGKLVAHGRMTKFMGRG